MLVFFGVVLLLQSFIFALNENIFNMSLDVIHYRMKNLNDAVFINTMSGGDTHFYMSMLIWFWCDRMCLDMSIIVV